MIYIMDTLQLNEGNLRFLQEFKYNLDSLKELLPYIKFVTKN